MTTPPKTPLPAAALVSASWRSSITRDDLTRTLDKLIKERAAQAAPGPLAAEALKGILDTISVDHWRGYSARHNWVSLCKGDGRSLRGSGEKWTLRREAARADGAQYAPASHACPIWLRPAGTTYDVSYRGTGTPPPEEQELLDLATAAAIRAKDRVNSRFWGEVLWPRLLQWAEGEQTPCGSAVIVEGEKSVDRLVAAATVLRRCGQTGVVVAPVPVQHVAAAAAEGLAGELDQLAAEAKQRLDEATRTQDRTIGAAQARIAAAEERLARYETALGEELTRLRESRETARAQWAQLQSNTAEALARQRAEKALAAAGGTPPPGTSTEELTRLTQRLESEGAAQLLDILKASGGSLAYPLPDEGAEEVVLLAQDLALVGVLAAPSLTPGDAGGIILNLALEAK